MRELVREFSQPARAVTKQHVLAMTHLNASDWSLQFISSTESYVIGYNAQCFKTCVFSGSVPASERRFEFSSWWCFSFLYIYCLQDKLRISPKIVCCDMIPNLGGQACWQGGTAPPPPPPPPAQNRPWSSGHSNFIFPSNVPMIFVVDHISALFVVVQVNQL